MLLFIKGEKEGIMSEEKKETFHVIERKKKDTEKGKKEKQKSKKKNEKRSRIYSLDR